MLHNKKGVFLHFSRPFCRSGDFTWEESPDSKGHHTPERGGIREGTATGKKITAWFWPGKGEKVR